LYSHQYGVPIKDFRLHIVAVIWAETPKSAKTQQRHKIIF